VVNFNPSYRSKEDSAETLLREFLGGKSWLKTEDTEVGALLLAKCRTSLRAQVYHTVSVWCVGGVPNRLIKLQGDNCTITNPMGLTWPCIAWVLGNFWEVTSLCWGILEQCFALELCGSAAGVVSLGTESNRASGGEEVKPLHLRV